MFKGRFSHRYVASNLPNAQWGARGVTTVQSTHGTWYGPFYRREGFGAKGDNTKAIVDEGRLLGGKGIGGRSDGVYAFMNLSSEELKEAENDHTPTIVFFAKELGNPGKNIGGDTMIWYKDELQISVAAVVGKQKVEVHKPDLWAEAVAHAAKQG